jgi:hypothetical protein
MGYGIIEYDEDGKPICEICKKSFHRVIAHVRQKHNMNEREYKKQFGFDLRKGICSKESSELSREKLFDNAEICLNDNLLKKGEISRFKKGSKGRTKNQVSEQTRIMLRNRLKQEPMLSKIKESGKKVGLSGLGNQKRWKK